MKDTLPDIARDIIDSLLLIEDPDDMYAFLRDLLTEWEIREFANRYRVAQLLDTGKSYVAIERETGMSSTTIARISRFLSGENKWYKKAIALLLSHHHTSPSRVGVCVDYQ